MHHRRHPHTRDPKNDTGICEILDAQKTLTGIKQIDKIITKQKKTERSTQIE